MRIPTARILGALTFGYGAYTLARPQSLIRAADLEATTFELSPAGNTLGRLIGTRDVLSGTAMMFARPGTPLEAAVVARVACDLSDVVGFGLSVPPRSRTKVVAIAAGWGLLCAASFPSARRRS